MIGTEIKIHELKKWGKKEKSSEIQSKSQGQSVWNYVVRVSPEWAHAAAKGFRKKQKGNHSYGRKVLATGYNCISSLCPRKTTETQGIKGNEKSRKLVQEFAIGCVEPLSSTADMTVIEKGHQCLTVLLANWLVKMSSVWYIETKTGQGFQLSRTKPAKSMVLE